MSTLNYITPEQLKKLLQYDPETGLFTWLASNNGVQIGDVAGYKTTDGYITIRVNYKLYLAHRLVWLYMTGEWPENQIDHENHAKDDNRFNNLCEATHQQNQMNRSMLRTNTSGITGVVWHKASNKWMAYINASSKRLHLGLFTKKWDAVCARKSAEIKYMYHINHGV